MFKGLHVTAIIPALNEAPAIGAVVSGIRNAIDTDTGLSLVDEIIVCDNGSTDGTGEIARNHGARVVIESVAGYGAACLAAISCVRPDSDLLVFVDADQSVDPAELPGLLAPFAHGADLVIGSRVLGIQESGALTPPQRFGNALASWLIRMLWQSPVSDLGPFRAIRQVAYQALGMKDKKYGWTVEMQIRAIQTDLNVTEVAVNSYRRVGQSKISGTVRGVIGAGWGILGKVFTLYLQEKLTNNQFNTSDSKVQCRKL